MFKRIILPAMFSLAVIGAVAGLAFATNHEAVPRGDGSALRAASAPSPQGARPSAPVVARLPETLSASGGDDRANVSRADDADAHDGDDDHDGEDEDDDEDDDDDDDQDDDGPGDEDHAESESD